MYAGKTPEGGAGVKSPGTVTGVVVDVCKTGAMGTVVSAVLVSGGTGGWQPPLLATCVAPAGTSSRAENEDTVSVGIVIAERLTTHPHSKILSVQIPPHSVKKYTQKNSKK